MGMDATGELRASAAELLERIEIIEQRLDAIENRLNAISGPSAEPNLRTSIAEALRKMADDLEDDIELEVPVRRLDDEE